MKLKASLILTLGLALLSPSFVSAEQELAPIANQATKAEQERAATTIVQLRDVQASLSEKQELRTALAKTIIAAGESVPKDMRAELEELDSEIDLLNQTFEQIATGGLDLTVFGVQDKQFNWREELVLIVKPLIENVKGLTEKPRQIENLKRIISDKSAAKEVSVKALASIERLKSKAEKPPVEQKLLSVELDWQGRVEDLDREVQLAQYQLDSLEGKDIDWFEVFKRGVVQFVQGRGLTIVLMVLMALFVWAIMRGILFLFRKRTTDSQDRSSKVHYRLAAYAYRLFTAILIAIGIMTVLYLRGDLLLLAIVVVLFFGAALALKNLLPQYITEGRILLNMGGVRERERIIYNGIPWQVSSINMFSRFTNPELKGGLRLPISQMHSMISRTSFNEPWFPSSEGDWILDESGDPVEVVTQTVDVIELRDLNAVCRFMPTDDFYRAGYQNVTRADKFRIAITFGIDYSTQGEDVVEIEKAFTEGLKSEFKTSEFDQYTLDIAASFHSAGDSSLNYLMLTTFKSEAAYGYNRIKRLINRACVKVCTAQEWTIPFPQMSVHVEASSDNADKDNTQNT